MFERILLPLDGSPTAEMILGQVRRILKRRDSEVIVLQAAVDLAAAESYVRGIEKRLNAEGATARALVREGPAAEAILETAAKEGASLIAMSTHGRTGIPRWVFGSVTEKILRAAEVPVLVMRSFRPGENGEPVPATSEELFLRKILIPIDESDLSLAVVPAAAELARLFESRVILLNVIEHGIAAGVPVPQMKRAADDLLAAGLRVEPILARGDPAVEILEACRQQDADLIAMSTHGRSGLSRWMLGSVTEKVLRTATVPILVAREPRGRS